jgi:ketosteroid isomerase-like protein
MDVRAVIEAKAVALSKGDVELVVSYYAPSVVRFNLAPPLRQPSAGRDASPLIKWMAGFASPPQREVTQLEIVESGDVAFATSLDSLTATPAGSTESFTLWFRVTTGLQKIDGEWLITHEHESVPFEMDGSFRASVGLKP